MQANAGATSIESSIALSIKIISIKFKRVVTCQSVSRAGTVRSCLPRLSRIIEFEQRVNIKLCLKLQKVTNKRMEC